MISYSLRSCRVTQLVSPVSCSSSCSCVIGMSFCSALSHPSKTPYLKYTFKEPSVQSQPCRDSMVESGYRCQAVLNKSRQRCLLKRYQKAIDLKLLNLCSTFLRVFDSSAI